MNDFCVEVPSPDPVSGHAFSVMVLPPRLIPVTISVGHQVPA
jgi:hypothetical protein